MLAAVEYEQPLYRQVNSYPHLAKEGVVGAPNSLKAGEMHARALDAIQRCYEKEVDEALIEYDHKVGGGASNRLKDVVKASHEGRVLKLFVSESLETTGAFDQATHTVKGRQTGASEDEDLVNDAVVQTILHAGHHARGQCGHGGYHPSCVVSGWGSPVSAARAAATSWVVART